MEALIDAEMEVEEGVDGEASRGESPADHRERHASVARVALPLMSW